MYAAVWRGYFHGFGKARFVYGREWQRSMRTVKQQQNSAHIFSSFLEKILLYSTRNK